MAEKYASQDHPNKRKHLLLVGGLVAALIIGSFALTRYWAIQEARSAKLETFSSAQLNSNERGELRAIAGILNRPVAFSCPSTDRSSSYGSGDSMTT